MIVIVYALFFVSGSAALIYEATWARALALVFGGSHLAVATVLAVFMGGLALGGVLFGRIADRAAHPLRLYGKIELGIGLSAAAFLLLVRAFPVVYAPVVSAAGENRVVLTVVRVAFATCVLIVPTSLMGGTLPVLARLLRGRIGLLYGVNTIGAVAGTLAVGFVLLEAWGVTRTVLFAVALNLAAGLVALVLPERAFEVGRAAPADVLPSEIASTDLAQRLVLWGAGVSGFCALAYEVLWTRMLGIVLGTSVYSFAIMLAAFLSGIGAGSAVWGWFRRGGVKAFALIQVGIGLAAFGATALMRFLPSHAAAMEAGPAKGFALAFGYMFVPALLMGVAFPLAGALRAGYRGARVAAAVGEVLAFNTVGAILGSAAAGFVLIQTVGVERALLVISTINVGWGVVVAASLRGPRIALACGLLAAAFTASIAAGLHGGRLWDEHYLAIWRNNTREVFDTPERVRDALENTDVLYWFEGADETISVVQPRGGWRAFIVNGRSEASTAPGDMQCQRVLGHLPVLLHPAPRKAFVLGAGSGMTLGAVTLHAEIDSIVLAELEPGVLGATRQFSEWNHAALDDARLRVVFDDGRNYLATTRERFDVITADPIHPWAGGAAYFYSTEYFQLVASRLAPGGIAAQWLPIYELTPEDVATVVRTFTSAFPHVLVWLTLWDTELIGSLDPIVIDERALAARLGQPAIAADLAEVGMGTADEFLSYFLMGTAGARKLGERGHIHSDDNLRLEFSAPRSMNRGELLAENAAMLAAYRESVVAHLAEPADPALWERRRAAGAVYDRAHALFLSGERGPTQPPDIDYAPLRFLEAAIALQDSSIPRLVDAAEFVVRIAAGESRIVRLSAVVMNAGPSRGAVVIVDNDARDIYGQVYLDRPPAELEDALRGCALRAMEQLRQAHAEQSARGAVTTEFLRAAVGRITADCAAF